MYKIIAALSILIRNFCLPNPFEVFGNIEIPFQGTVIAIPPIIVNFMFEPIRDYIWRCKLVLHAAQK